MTDDEIKRLLADATPGPWMTGTSNDHWRREVRVASDSTGVAWCGRGPTEEAHADARLIAAAPDLAAEVLRLRKLATGIGGPARIAIAELRAVAAGLPRVDARRPAVCADDLENAIDALLDEARRAAP